ncbi:MAG TPA: hypothetical protein ENK02_03020 [Planctomycetes bacterium]|nr:hypothetical protein [Planctomycetota bacterium]
MEQFLKWLAGLGPGEGQAGEKLRFEFSSLPGGTLALLSIAATVAILFLVFYLYKKDARRLSPAKRSLLAFLRLMALASIALLLLEPTLVKVRKSIRPGEVIVLLDASQSMGHLDSYAHSEKESDSWKAIGVEDPSTMSRFGLSIHLLKTKDILNTLAKKNLVRVRLFGEGSRPAPEKQEREKGKESKTTKASKEVGGKKLGKDQVRLGRLPPPPVLDWDAMKPTEGGTNLTTSLRQALDAVRSARVAGVILLTDGRVNLGGRPEEAGAILARKNIDKVYVVGVGDPREAWIVSLSDLQAPEKVFKGDPVPVSVRVQSQGYPLQQVEVRLMERSEGGRKTLATKRVELGGDQPSVTVKFPPQKLEKEGEHVLEVELGPPEGEDFDRERHRIVHRVQVLTSTLDVLVIAGSPTFEYRLVKTQLQRDDTVKVACWLQSAEKGFPQEGNVSLRALPKDPKELDEWDVIVFLDPDPRSIPLEFSQMVERAVSERGTGLWWVMGDKFSLSAIQPDSSLKPLVDLLPIVPDLPSAEREIGYGRFFRTAWPWHLTTEGKRHRSLRLVSSPEANEQIWGLLPGFHWSFPVLRKKPAAFVLIDHPNDAFMVGGQRRPILATQFVGAGRVSYSGTDETYRWFGVMEPAFNRYWLKGLRFLSEGRLTAGSGRYKLGLSLTKVTLGKEVEIFLRALNENFEPLIAEDVPVRVQGPKGSSFEVRLKPLASGEGRYRGAFRPTGTGTWTVTAMSGDGAGKPVTFEVQRSKLESRGPMDRAGLQRLAKTAGGEFLMPDHLADRVAGIPSRSRTSVYAFPFPLWDNWFSLALVVFFLTLEWILRKRFDLI